MERYQDIGWICCWGYKAMIFGVLLWPLVFGLAARRARLEHYRATMFVPGIFWTLNQARIVSFYELGHCISRLISANLCYALDAVGATVLIEFAIAILVIWLFVLSWTKLPAFYLRHPELIR